MITVRFFKGKDHFADAYAVREAVFILEQGFENEIDEWDDRCIHCVLYKQDKPVACGRFFSEAAGEITIGRIAVLKEYRQDHLGSKVMAEIEKQAAALGYCKAHLSAQCQARGFYEKLGYQAVGEVYLDEHCPHIRMEKQLFSI